MEPLPKSSMLKKKELKRKIEQELAHVDESLYIERINKVIQADERLQRIVDQYIIHRIVSDEKPQTVQTSNPQNINHYEE